VKRFVLLDRDGTIIVEKHYLHDPEQVELFEGAAQALAEIRTMGWGLVCVSNQAGVGRGYFPESDVHAVNEKVQSMLGDGKLDAYYFCPDHPDAASNHRKPNPGMAQDAAAEFGFELAASVVVGDKPCDIDLGKNIGAITVLVRTGYGAQHERDGDCEPDHVIDSISDLPAILKSL
jgi:D-glycero-D-manno-heptose 1,7-bisphosphate phosphatase